MPDYKTNGEDGFTVKQNATTITSTTIHNYENERAAKVIKQIKLKAWNFKVIRERPKDTTMTIQFLDCKRIITEF